MTAIHIYFLGFAVPSFIIGYVVLGVCGFSKYGNLTLKVKIVWNIGNRSYLRIINNDITYLNCIKDVLIRAGNTCLTNVCVHPACN